jgi:hypothetical protein
MNIPIASSVDTGFDNPVIWVCSGGQHEWLPWLHRADGYVTRCVHCGREEQFDDTVKGPTP